MLGLMQAQLDNEMDILIKLQQRPCHTLQNMIVIDRIQARIQTLKKKIDYDASNRQEDFTHSDTNISTQHAKESCGRFWGKCDKGYRAVLRVFARKALQEAEVVKC